MMRHVPLLPALACVVCGCASPQPHDLFDECDKWVMEHARATSALLFDQRPGALPASLYAGRSDWPGVFRDHPGGEVEVYDVFIYDRQGGDDGYFDYGLSHFHRTFRSRRSGMYFR